MTKFAKFVATAIVALFAFSCTTDTTDDLAVNMGGQTTLTIALSDTRTQLGTADNGVFPLTWCEGDQITVNGITSEPLTAKEAGKAKATFTFKATTLTTPYHIVYPAAESESSVVFAAEQKHISNSSFGNGAAVMYGYSENGKTATLQHLTGLIKISIVGSETLSCVRVSTADRKPIAGVFDINFSTGKIAATDATSEVVTYSFGKGVELKKYEATTAYIALPAGTYGDIFVTLIDANGGAMYHTISANSAHPLTAGKIRNAEKTITYAAMEKVENEEAFTIKDFESLLAFKEAVESAQATIDSSSSTDKAKAAADKVLSKETVLVNDITIPSSSTNKAWKSICAPSYKGTFNGNGYAIIFDSSFTEKNKLTHPLFDVTAATIKGVHLKGININNDCTSENIGALVNTFKGTYIAHCSVEGKITLSRTGSHDYKIGALVGMSEFRDSDIGIAECISNCKMEITTVKESSSEYIIGGLVGYFENKTTYGNDDEDIYALSLLNNTTKGHIKVNGNGSTESVYVSCGVGKIGYYKTAISNCHNSGNITVELDYAKPMYVGAILAAMYNAGGSSCRYRHLTVTNCSNSGNIKASVTNTSSGTSNTAIGGLFGNLYNEEEGSIKLTDCINSGSVEFYGMPTASKLTTRVDVGGIVGNATSRVNITGCENRGEKVYVELGTQSSIVTVGGIAGRAVVKASNNVSNSSNIAQFNNCTNRTEVSVNINTSNSEVAIGGIAGGWYCEGAKFGLTATNNKNEGNLTSHIDNTNSSSRVYIGLFGTTYLSGASERSNFKDIQKFKLTNCVNGKAEGQNTITATGSGYYRMYAGGIVGYCANHFTITDCVNNTSYLYDAKSCSYHYYGGLFGYLCPRRHLETLDSQDDTLGTKKLWTKLTNFTNNGDATLNITNEKTSLYLGGIIGNSLANAEDLYLEVVKAVNNGNLTVTKSPSANEGVYKTLYIASLFGYMDSSSSSIYDISGSFINRGDISITELTPASGAKAYIGGVAGYLRHSLSNIKSYCSITVDADIAAGLLAGVASTTDCTFTNCAVGGTIVEGATTTTIDEGNLAKYIFNDRVLTEYDGVTLLASAPEEN
ncbi:MAG: hypothetical protein IKW61_04510 [Bacteroidaceae bacterium]|nr:hypothetical protein [Bacteroidaceae bacterium]